jgi:hypothetical protein
VRAGGVGKTWLGGFGWVITYNNLVKRSSKDQKKENGTGLMIACELLGGDRKLFLVVATYSTLLHPLLPSHVCIYIYIERERERFFFGVVSRHLLLVRKSRKSLAKFWRVHTQSQLFSIHVRFEFGYCQNTKRKPTKHLKSSTIVHIAALESLTPSCMMIQFSNK